MTNKHNPLEVNGFWNDTKEPFYSMYVSAGSWDGLEDHDDEAIFFYCDGAPILGDHGDFTITEVLQ